MDITNPDIERYQRARKRVEDLKGFYIHVSMYLIVNIGLIVINLLTTDNWWFYWPLIGWGIGLAAHAFAVFVEGSRFARNWEDRKLRQVMREQDR
jgi:hypothetical protein